MLAYNFPDVIWFGFYFFVFLFFVLIPLGVVYGIYTSVLGLSEPEKCIEPVENHEAPARFRLAARHNQWATEHGFEWVGAFAFRGPAKIFIAIWEHTKQPIYFCLYSHSSNNYYDFVTIFENDRSLTTGSTKDAHTLPHQPGAYVQSFPNLSHRELWKKHKQADKYLTRQCGLKKQRLTKTFEEFFVSAIRQQTEYVRSLFLWPVRGIFWYFVKRHLMQNRSIETQFPGGMLDV